MKHKHYNPDRFTRKSLRLPNRDYTAAGAYFVTIHALPSHSFFTLPKLHQILADTWQTLPKRFPNVKLDAFVIMPDHIHFILWLDGTKRKWMALGNIVGAYKSITTVLWLKHLKAIGKDIEYPCQIWQDDYYEHVVRIGELEATRQYIRDNPKKALSQLPHVNSDEADFTGKQV
jgi:putative transposase